MTWQRWPDTWGGCDQKYRPHRLFHTTTSSGEKVNSDCKTKKMSERVTNNIGFNSNSSKAASDNAHNVPRVSWIGIHETDSSDFFYSRDSFITHKNRKCLLGLIIGWCNSLKYDKLLLSYLYTPGFEQLCRRMGQ